MTWRERADMVLSDLFDSLPADATDTEIDAAVFDAYPFGERRYTPYKIWLQQVKRHKGARAIGLRGPLTPPGGKRRDSKDRRQKELF